MKEEITFSTFCDRFNAIRPNNFTYDGLKALFDYLEELEEDTGTEFELDVIALCCGYCEYKNVNEYLNDYYTTEEINEKWNDLKDTFPDNYTEEDKQEDFKEEILKEIQEKTTLIMIDDEAFIIGSY